MANIIERVRKLKSHSIDSRKLKPGDHIYAYRDIGIFSHHGIFVGEGNPGYVIHFLKTKEKTPCQKCPPQSNEHLGIVKTCLDCFLREGSPLVGRALRLYHYEQSSLEKKLKRSGSCSTLPAKPSEEVVKTATELLDKGFGEYDLTTNNCEHFATFCKTGIRSSAQVDSAGQKTTKFVSAVGSAFTS